MNNHARYGDRPTKSETLERVTGLSDQLNGERRRNTGLRDEVDQLRQESRLLREILAAYEVGEATCAITVHSALEQVNSWQS